MKKLTLLFISFWFFASCGESPLELEQTYEPKIVLNAILFPGQVVSGISLTRNIPLNTQPNPATLFISDADVSITDLVSNKNYKLSYNSKKFSYEYKGTDWKVEYNRSYKLLVSAKIDNTSLSAESITTTPRQGFSIVNEKTVSGDIPYRPKDAFGNVNDLKLVINLSQGTNYYPVSLVALDASDTTFIYDNPFADIKKEDVVKNIERMKYVQQVILNINPAATIFNFDVRWTLIWFYSRYRLIAYAADENLRQYNLTYRGVQEFDGNFHEPRINIKGDGIGVFGSMIADTVYFRVKK